VCAHALDELNGRPLRTQLSNGLLIGLAAVALAGAVAVGIVGAVTVSLGLLPFVAAGAFIVVAYNFELFGGRFHSDFWFAVAWGAFPALTAYWINALQFRLQGLLVAAACAVLSFAQRRLSTPVRALRRRTISVDGEQRLADGTIVKLDAARLAAPLDEALRACAFALPLLAAGLVIARL
jgi:ABC-type branched-subunit amino acid transport system permease subunit